MKKTTLFKIHFSFLCFFLVLLFCTTDVLSSLKPKVLIIEFHGIKQGVFQNNLDKLPNFKKLIKGSHDNQAYVYLPNVFTTLPAASVPAVTAMYTGVQPGRTGVVSTIWFDRSTLKIRTMLSYSQQRINRVLKTNQIKTIFEYARNAGKTSLSSMLIANNGADWKIKSSLFFWGNASTLGFIRKGHWIPDGKYVDRQTVKGFLNGHLLHYYTSLAGIYEYHHHIPDLMVLQLMGTDMISHFPKPELILRQASLNEIQKRYAIEVLDPLMGKLISFFNKVGQYKNLIVILVSEQGFSKIEKHIDNHIISQSLKQKYCLPGFLTTKKNAEAVIMPGACTKEIYLKNRETNIWTDPPRLLQDVKPAIDLLLDNKVLKECLNTLVIRNYPGRRFEGKLETGLWWVFNWRSYQNGLKDESSFLQVLLPLHTLSKNFKLAAYLADGLKNQYSAQTAPDIKLINKEGFYFENDKKKYGHHGSYYPADCMVSFHIAGPGLAHTIAGRHTLIQPASTMDLIPMATWLLGIKEPDGLDGNNPISFLAK